MSGSNTTGVPQTSDYLLCRGRLYGAPIDAATGLPGAWRDFGNAPSLSLSLETEKLEHFSSRAGLKKVDKEVIISQKTNTSVTLDEINAENFAMFLSGDSVTEAATENLATIATQTLTIQDVGGSEKVTVGRWYDVVEKANNANYRKRAYGFSTTPTVKLAARTLTEGTDFDFDKTWGMVFLKAPSAPANGEDLIVSWTSALATATFDEVRAATKTNVSIALKFIGVNAANNNEEFELVLHQVSLKPNGDFSLIGDEFAKMEFTGVAEENVLADPNAPVGRLRWLN